MSVYSLERRGFVLGSCEVTPGPTPGQVDAESIVSNWRAGKPSILKGFGLGDIPTKTSELTQAKHLYEELVKGSELDAALCLDPYEQRLALQFDPLGSAFNEGNKQEIETVFFDAIENGSAIAEDLWVKVSWLSFHDADASIRFRFSFGVDFEEDVASDHQRQIYASKLAEAIFPESSIVAENDALIRILHELLNTQSVDFVERIVYFNAPGGGAYLHHDRERGHAGVVYAQLTGKTFWLALPRHLLINEIRTFIQECDSREQWPENLTSDQQLELKALADNRTNLTDELESFANTAVITLINETQEFIERLTKSGHGCVIEQGDFFLLPQETDDLSCWHSVFCLGDEAGQALSFAVRTN